jgi:hypothetical protein
MKSLSKNISWVLIVILALFVSESIQAGDKKTITLYEKSQISDTNLTPGNYKVEVVTNGDSGELYFYRGKNVVAKTPVELEKLDTTVDHSSLRYQVEQGQSRRIVEVRLAGQSQVYKIVEKETQATKKNSSSGS